MNSIYRTNRNVVMTPLDCSLQKGLRSTAKFLQLHGGLPASKLRLSGRNPNAINDQELVKPLSFGNATETGVTLPPIMENGQNDDKKRIVVYVKRSDSEEYSCDGEKVPKQYHKIRSKCEHYEVDDGQQRQHRHHHRRRHRYRLRTSSCEAIDRRVVTKEDSSSDICRSKSNIEIRRRRKSKNKRDSTSISDQSTTDDDSDCDCRRHGRRRHYRHRRRCGERSNSRRKKSKVENDDSDKAAEADACKKRRKKKRKSDETSTEDTAAAVDKDKNSKPTETIESNKSDKNTEQLNEAQTTKEEPDKSDKKQQNEATTKVDEEVKKEAAKDVKKSERKRPQSAKGSAGKNRLSKTVASSDKTSVPVPEVVEKKVNFTEAQLVQSDNIIVTKADVHAANVSESEDVKKSDADTKAATEKVPDKDDGNLTDATFTVDATKIKETSKPEETETTIEKPNLPMAETTADSVQTNLEPSDTLMPPVLEVEDKTKTNEQPIEERTVQSDPQKSNVNTGDDNDKTIVETTTATESPAKNKPEMELQPAPAEEQPRKSSFTVLASDESVDLAVDFETESEKLIERRKSFKVLSSLDKDTTQAEDEAAPDEQPDQVYSSEYDDDEFEPSRGVRSASATQIDRSGRRKRLKKRIKPVGVKQYAADGSNGESVYQHQSRDHDSGFEPSPRAIRSKIPSPRAVYTAVMPRRTGGGGIPDSRSCSSRYEGRKLGDKNAVNMTTVTQSIQRNIKRLVRKLN